jgi:hypothetical protein
MIWSDRYRINRACRIVFGGTVRSWQESETPSRIENEHKSNKSVSRTGTHPESSASIEGLKVLDRVKGAAEKWLRVYRGARETDEKY